MIMVFILSFVYVDIKPENLLLSDNDSLKLADFGSAKRVDQKGVVAVSTRSISGGTPAFMAPELLSRGNFSHSFHCSELVTDMGITMVSF